MLRKLHNKKVQKRIWIFLLIFILPGFVVWGFSSSVRSVNETDSGYGKIFKHNVSREQYSEAVKSIETQLQMQLGDNYAQLQKLFDLKSMALQRLVMLYEADKRKIRVSDRELIDYIQKDPSFYHKGAFDSSFYEQVIKYSLHMQPRSYEEMTRQNLKIRRLVADVTREVKVTDEEIREAYSKENLQMSVYYLAAIPADFAKELKPSEAELKDYFDKNSISFKKPLSFDLEYLTLDSIGQIIDLKDRMEKKESLEKIARDNNLTVKNTGLFGQTDPIPGIGWSQEISKSLDQLKSGEMLGPIEIEKKYYLFRVKERKEPFIPEFKDIKDEVLARLITSRSRETARSKIEAAAKKIQETPAANPKETDFDKLAKEFGLKSSSTGMFKFGSYIESIGASDSFFNTAAKLKPGLASELIELPSGFYIVKLKENPALDEKKFAAEKEEFAKKVLDERKQDYFDKFLKELVKKSQSS